MTEFIPKEIYVWYADDNGTWRIRKWDTHPFAEGTKYAVSYGLLSEPGWRPIDTAPKDEETVLLLVPTLYGKWNKTLPLAGRWESRNPPNNGFWVIFNADEAVQLVEPTHWMPLLGAPR